MQPRYKDDIHRPSGSRNISTFVQYTGPLLNEHFSTLICSMAYRLTDVKVNAGGLTKH